MVWTVQLFQVDIKSGKTIQLTTVPGMHNASVSSDGTDDFRSIQ